MHGTGECTEPRIVTARCLFDRFGIGGKFIPKPVEVDALAALDQSLHIRSTEVEVPARGKLRSKCTADHIADVVRDECGLLDLWLVP